MATAKQNKLAEMAERHIKELCFTLGGTPACVPSRKRPRVSTDGESRERVSVRFVELIDQLEQAEDEADLHFGLFIWPCAQVLAQYVASYHRHSFAGRTVLELGCGIALPGILAALCGNIKKVILSDRADSDSIQRNVQANIDLNGIAHIATYLPLNWGALDLLDHFDTFRDVDIILAADCFYQSQDFEKVLATVALVFRLNPTCTFITAYQLRSINRSIAPLLVRYAMTARILDKRDFMQENVSIPGSEGVYVYEISPIV